MASCIKQFLDCALPPPHRQGTVRARAVADALPIKRGCANEARGWIATNKNAYPFASNRFKDRHEAVALVDKLYGAGASCVQVSGILAEPRRVAEEGGPYADALLVSGPASKHAAFQAVARPYDPDESRVKGGKLRLWWD